MNTLFAKVKAKAAKPHQQTSLKETFTDETGAIDLSSIMVGIIVIGLIGGIIAATVFAVIPWSQDNAAKQQLDSILQAQNSYFGLSTSSSSGLPAGSPVNSFADTTALAAAKLLSEGPTFCTVTTNGGKGFAGYAKSASGSIYTITDKNTKPTQFTGALPTDCGFLAYDDPKARITTMTYKCDVATTGVIPLQVELTGTEKWSDGVTNTYNNAAAGVSRNFDAGVTYTLNFEGTYKEIWNRGSANPLAKCLRSVDHWGMATGVTKAAWGFDSAVNLTSVPAQVPTTITNMFAMFNNAQNFNDPNVAKWDVSNVTNMRAMFSNTEKFNQSLDSWNTSSVTDMSAMFSKAKAFNGSINNWDVSKVKYMNEMFWWADQFNQPLDKWNTSNVETMRIMFFDALKFDQPLNTWNTSKVTNMYGMFQEAYAFNQPLDKWDTSQVTDMGYMFRYAKGFVQPLSTFKTGNVTNMDNMFSNAINFDQPLNTWDVSKVTNMRSMFLGADKFNRNLSGWNTAALTYAPTFANPSYNTAYLPAKVTL